MWRLLRPIEDSLRKRYKLEQKGTIQFSIYKNPRNITKGEEHTCRTPFLYGLASHFAGWVNKNHCDFILLARIPAVGYRIIKPPHNIDPDIDELSLSWELGQIGTGPYVDQEPLAIDIVDEENRKDALELIVEEYLQEGSWHPLYDAWPYIESKPKKRREFVINLAQMIAVMHKRGYAYNDSFSTHLHYNNDSEELKLIDFGITAEDRHKGADRLRDTKKLLDQLKHRAFSQQLQKMFLEEYCEFATANKRDAQVLAAELFRLWKTNTRLELRRGQLVEVPL